MGNYGEFEEIDNSTGVSVVSEGEIEAPVRARTPRKGEVIGVILQRYGGNRMEVCGTDGVKRNCRVPGKYRRVLWLRPKDIVLITPWPNDNEKGDVIFKYNGPAISQLRKKGFLDNLKNEF